MERLQTGQDRSSASKVRRLDTGPAGQRYAMVIPSYFSSLSRFNAKKPSPYHHDMQGKTILAFRRIVLLIDGGANRLALVRTDRAPTAGCDTGDRGASPRGGQGTQGTLHAAEQ